MIKESRPQCCSYSVMAQIFCSLNEQLTFALTGVNQRFRAELLIPPMRATFLRPFAKHARKLVWSRKVSTFLVNCLTCGYPRRTIRCARFLPGGVTPVRLEPARK